MINHQGKRKVSLKILFWISCILFIPSFVSSHTFNRNTPSQISESALEAHGKATYFSTLKVPYFSIRPIFDIYRLEPYWTLVSSKNVKKFSYFSTLHTFLGSIECVLQFLSFHESYTLKKIFSEFYLRLTILKSRSHPPTF